MTTSVCSVEGCDRDVGIGARQLCAACYQRAWKAGELEPLPHLRRRRRPGPHTCVKHDPSPACYANCGCPCDGCLAAQAAKQRDRSRRKAYGTYDPGMVDAEPVRRHVEQLRRPGPNGEHGMGKRRIADKAGVNRSVVTKLVHGQPARGSPPSRRLSCRNAQLLLAVDRDLADGAWVDAGATRRKIDALVAGGFAKVELARYLTGDSNTQKLQVVVPARRLVTVRNARQVDELHRRWKAGRIVPRGKRTRYDDGPPPTVPLEVDALGVIHTACEDCGAPSLAGGRWCWTCFSARANPRTPTGCGTDAGYAAHRRRGETPCPQCREAHTAATRERQAA